MTSVPRRHHVFFHLQRVRRPLVVIKVLRHDRPVGTTSDSGGAIATNVDSPQGALMGALLCDDHLTRVHFKDRQMALAGSDCDAVTIKSAAERADGNRRLCKYRLRV